MQESESIVFQIEAGPVEDRRKFCGGELLSCNNTLAEYKTFFEGRTEYESPIAHFATPNGSIPVELSRTDKGYAGKAYRGSIECGLNLNRVRRSTSRWGVTAWIRYKGQGAA